MLGPAGCHPDRPAKGRGMCNSCYVKWYRKNNINSKKARCHPERAHVAKGLCNSCYTAKAQKVPKRVRVALEVARLALLSPDPGDDTQTDYAIELINNLLK